MHRLPLRRRLHRLLRQLRKITRRSTPEGVLLSVLKKHVIARRAEPDVAIPWIFKHFCSMIGGFSSIYGIATPVCALARNDVRNLGVLLILSRNLFVGVGAHDDPFKNIPNSPEMVKI